MNETSFLQLFSDEAATPNPDFIASLETRVLSVAGVSYNPRVSLRTKVLVGLGIALVVGLILAAVFLPKRDMSDATKDSVIETVVNNTVESASPFVAPATQPTAATDTPVTNSPVATPQSNAPETSENSTAPASTPIILSDFQVQYWNHDDPSNLSPLIPPNPPVYTSTAPAIQFSWGTSSPHPLVDADAFIARFTKSAAIPSGTYKVDFSNNDGLRMIVNESVVFDHWDDGVSGGTAYFSTDLSLPITSIEIDYHDASGPAFVSLTITKQN